METYCFLHKSFKRGVRLTTAGALLLTQTLSLHAMEEGNRGTETSEEKSRSFVSSRPKGWEDLPEEITIIGPQQSPKEIKKNAARSHKDENMRGPFEDWKGDNYIVEALPPSSSFYRPVAIDNDQAFVPTDAKE